MTTDRGPEVPRPPRPTRRGLLAAATTAGTTVAAIAAASGAGAARAAGTRRLPAKTVSARRRFFGADVVDDAGRPAADRVVLSWFGVSGFALAMGGRVVLLDAWIPRGTYSGYVPAEVEDLVALRPSHVLLGHGHFDHAADAPAIAAETGAVVVGTAEHCAQVEGQAGTTLRTLPVVPAGSPEGTTGRLRIGRVRVDAVTHVHSSPQPPTGESAPVLPSPDLLPCLEHPPTPADAVDTLSHQADQEGGTLAYRLRLGDFSCIWHDSSGPLRTQAPDAEAELRRWRGADVQVGSIQGFGQYTNGLRDPLWYVEAVRPRVFVPAHHDNWQPPASAPAATYEGRLRESLAALPDGGPRLRMLRDPDDYVRPERLTFRV